ncbi:hypothetical protein J4G37_30500 [Microvirga sp. 3-52]|nr:hypothetical protein [Microvirga sp. 3-52]
MCSNRHQPCLAVSPSQSGGLAIGLRPAIFPVVVISALLLLSSLGGGQTRDPQQAALDDFVVARTLTDKCPTWQIDFAEVGRRFAQLKLQPADLQKGGRHASFFDERLSYYSGLLSRMSQMAEEAFGPNGLIRKNWMKRQ